MKVIIVSHNFNPGHFSHLYANYKLVTGSGLTAGFYWNDKFDKFLKDDEKKKVLKLNATDISKNDIYVVWFPSLKALAEMVYLRLMSKGQIIYVLHEPFDSIKSYLDSGFTVLKTLKILAVSFINYLMVKCSHKIILPSSKAFTTFKLRYNFLGPSIKIPLMFDDEAVSILPISKRKFISYIGTIAEDHAFDEYVKFIIHSITNDWFPKYKFLIATKSFLPLDQRNLLLPHIESGAVILEEGSPMSNDKINDYYNNSIVVWNAYRRSMQSGVLPKAYMFGAPLLVSTCNSSEYFNDREHGVIVSEKYDIDDLKMAVDDIISHFEKYSKYCRDKFLKTFFYKANEYKFINFVLDGMERGE